MKNSDIDFVDILHKQKNEKINSIVLLFFFLIILFFIGVFIWAYFSKIDELARGEGKVIPSEKIKIVQSLDGGLISKILIKEGDFVKKGTPLIKIDTTRFQASFEGNRNTQYHLMITKKRLEAQASLNLEKPIPELIYEKKLLEKAPKFVENDIKLFNSNIEELKGSIKILQTKLKEKKEEIKELKIKSYQLKKRLNIVKQEVSTLKQLVKNRSRSKIDLLNVQKESIQINGELQTCYATIRRSKIAIDGIKDEIVQKLQQFRADSSNKLQKINTEIKKYESKLISENDRLTRTILHSPVDGIIKQINFNTIGGVVKSGMDLIEIVPQSDILLVEAKINPRDIAFINPKQKAIVKITAYDFSIYGGLDGKIVEISADSLIDKDDRQKKSYYKVVIQTNKNYLERNGEKLPIIPGMIANVDIITGEKTIFDFILKPILKTKQNALHER